jgi:hypothetical protein
LSKRLDVEAAIDHVGDHVGEQLTKVGSSECEIDHHVGVVLGWSYENFVAGPNVALISVDGLLDACGSLVEVSQEPAQELLIVLNMEKAGEIQEVHDWARKHEESFYENHWACGKPDGPWSLNHRAELILRQPNGSTLADLFQITDHLVYV